MSLPVQPPALALVLAAGKGARMNSRHPKAIHALLGKPLARHAIDLVRPIAERTVVVVGAHEAAVRAGLGDELEYRRQEVPRGTGDAVLAACDAVENAGGPVLVLQADNPLFTSEVIGGLLARFHETGASAVLLSAQLPDPGSYGRLLRDPSGAVLGVIEARGAVPEVLAIHEINVGAYVFQPASLLRALRGIGTDPTTGELYLTSVIRALVEQGERVEAVRLEDPETALGVNDRRELAEAARILRQRVLGEHMRRGVTIEDPAATYIDAEVTIGRDTVIRPMTFLRGKTIIGEECEIGPNAQIADCRLGDGVVVQNAVLAESEVGDGTKIGPFAQLRPGCRLGRKVKIGNFVELKKAEVEDRVSAGHLAYLGDTFIGEHTNIGAGTITCNYDGKRKHRTLIGKGSFVGSHSTLVAPIELGEGAFTAAGSVITQDVPADGLAVGRAHQVNKPEWARRRRELLERE